MLQFQHPKGPKVHQTEDEIQLLYVPLDTFYQQKQQPPFITQHRYNILPPPVNPAQINNFYTPPPTTSTTTSTTPKPKPKLKPHQPPLAMFMRHEPGETPSSVNDVLKTLKHAKTIDVLDAPMKNAPNIFIGPSGLRAPDNYFKYDLPYLSTIEQNRFERKVENLPFFVAPLSYNTPNGFAKIPLPAPHVGSVVVNSPTTPQPELSTPPTKKPFFGTPLPQKYDPQTNKYINMPLTENYSSQNAPIAQSTAQPPTAVGYQSVDRLPSFTTHSPRQYFTSPDQPQRVQQTFPAPNPGVFQFSFDNAAHRPRTQQNSKLKVTFAQNSNPHVVNEEYFSLDKTKASQTSQQDFTGPVDIRYEQKINPQLTPNFSFDFRPQPPTTSTQAPEEPVPVKTQPQSQRQGHYILSAPVQQEYQTFSTGSRTPPKMTFSTGPFESSKETYNAYEVAKRPSVLNYFPSSTTTTTTSPPPAQTPTSVTYYKPKPAIPLDDEYQSAQPHRKPVHSFKFVPTVLGTTPEPEDEQPVNYRTVFTKSTQTPQQSTTRRPTVEDYFVPTERTVYQHVFPTDSTYSPAVEIGGRHQDDYYYSTTDEPVTTTTQPSTTQNLYQSSYSELPQINANLPGLVNSLMDNDQVTEEPYTTTTRRPTHRGRRPQPPRTTTATQSSEAVTRRPVQRTRTRPTRPPNTSPNTYRTSTVVRNPNRVRFNPNADDQTLPARPKVKPYSQKVKEEQNLEYQRDVLKQNYPVIKPLHTTTTEVVRQTEPQLRDQVKETASRDNQYYDIRAPTEENQVTSSREEIQQEYVLPANHAPAPLNELQPTLVSTTTQEAVQQQEEERTELFPGLAVKAMQLPQEYAPSARDEYPRQEEPERVVVINGKPRDHKFPVFISSTESPSTTTAAPTTIASRLEAQRIRRPSFVKRPTRPNYTTTSPRNPTTDANEERYTARSRFRTEGRSETTTHRPAAPKIRSRLRRPTTTTTTAQYEDEYQTEVSATEEPRSRYKISQRSQYRPRQKSRFGLQTQETQWSTKLSQSSFQPIEHKESGKLLNDYDPENEPEIVTAGSEPEEETYEFKVTPARTPNMMSFNENETNNQSREDRETTLANLLEDVVTEVDNDLGIKQGLVERNEVLPKRPESDSASEASSATTQATERPTKGRRKGVWRRVRVRPVSDAFETAESINIGRQVFNVLENGKKEPVEEPKVTYESHSKKKDSAVEEVTSPGDIDLGTGAPEDTTDAVTDHVTDPVTETRIPEEEETSPVMDYTDMDTEETYTAKVEPIEVENPTRQGSMFDEVRKKLVDLFMMNEEEEEARTMRSFDDQTTIKVEKTTTQAPPRAVTEYSPFLRDPVMGNLVIATSTSTEISHQTEICFRGRCVKSVKT
ncbi:mucin-2 [Phlebotomus argentipes]|uniref:mucin-2 n=1 Tax=Phlebotomus argentipes TaxID=94469 RepID=UPI002892E7CC|nr:mucin-2 [Phlebotomus argentipes]